MGMRRSNPRWFRTAVEREPFDIFSCFHWDELRLPLVSPIQIAWREFWLQEETRKYRDDVYAGLSTELGGGYSLSEVPKWPSTDEPDTLWIEP